MAGQDAEQGIKGEQTGDVDMADIPHQSVGMGMVGGNETIIKSESAPDMKPIPSSQRLKSEANLPKSGDTNTRFPFSMSDIIAGTVCDRQSSATSRGTVSPPLPLPVRNNMDILSLILTDPPDAGAEPNLAGSFTVSPNQQSATSLPNAGQSSAQLQITTTDEPSNENTEKDATVALSTASRNRSDQNGGSYCPYTGPVTRSRSKLLTIPEDNDRGRSGPLLQLNHAHTNQLSLRPISPRSRTSSSRSLSTFSVEQCRIRAPPSASHHRPPRRLRLRLQ